jgi:hypothetical protein
MLASMCLANAIKDTSLNMSIVGNAVNPIKRGKQ